MIDKDKLFFMLDWNNSQELQKKGIELGLKIEDLQVFMQDGNGKNVWGNCAKILSQKSDEELKPYLPEILEWLQDLTWPGALTILERLKQFDYKILKIPFEQAIQKANEENDITWIGFLSYIFENDKKENLKNVIDYSYLKIIEEACEELEKY